MKVDKTRFDDMIRYLEEIKENIHKIKQCDEYKLTAIYEMAFEVWGSIL